PTAGFIGKYNLFAAVIERGRAGGGSAFYLAAVLAVLNSVVSLYYYARVLRAMYIDAAKPQAAVHPAPLHTAVLGAPVAPVLLLGRYWAPLQVLARAALVVWSPAAAVTAAE